MLDKIYSEARHVIIWCPMCRFRPIGDIRTAINNAYDRLLEVHQNTINCSGYGVRNRTEADSRIETVATNEKPHAHYIPRIHGSIPLHISEALAKERKHLDEQDCEGVCCRRCHFKCFVSTSGFMGLVMPKARVGDHIVTLFGLEMSFVVRHDLEYNHYWLIGECFVLGLMDGEALEDLDESRVEDFHFW
jgi:hypothetical protein